MDDEKIILAAMAPTRVGAYWDTVEAPSFDDPSRTIRLGVTTDTFQLADRVGTVVAQYTYLVRPGLISAVHLFRGLKRQMKVGNDMHADAKVFAYMWRPRWDFEWVGGRNSSAFPMKHASPTGRAFVVLARALDEPRDGVSGSILKWNWIFGDVTNFDWNQRYAHKVWSRY